MFTIFYMIFLERAYRDLFKSGLRIFIASKLDFIWIFENIDVLKSRLPVPGGLVCVDAHASVVLSNDSNRTDSLGLQIFLTIGRYLEILTVVPAAALVI